MISMAVSLALASLGFASVSDEEPILEEAWFQKFEGLKGLPSWMSSTDLHKMNGVIGERAKKMYVSWLAIHVRNGDPMDTEIELPLIIGEGKASR